MIRISLIFIITCLVGCTTQPDRIATVSAPSLMTGASASPQQRKSFAFVVQRLNPVAERICRESTRNARCDFDIRVDPNPMAPVNAFQTLDGYNRPVIIFTQAMIDTAQNNDELALVLGHESAHHIMGHIGQRQAQSASAGLIFGLGAVLAGADAQAVEAASKFGQSAGALTYSKQHELEADQLGARIARAAGFDPLRGVAFFNRIPDPGDAFLATHPGNADRYNVVRNAVSGY